MTKQEKFLYIVQMSTLANCVNLSTSHSDVIENYRHIFSSTGVFNVAQHAIRVSEIIPEDLTAADAASEFLNYYLRNLRENGESEVTCPEWCVIRD